MRRTGLLLGLLSLSAFAAEGNLLAGRAPVQISNVTEPQRMTDGVACPEGDNWTSTRTSILAVGGSVVWDLGAPTKIGAAMLQGDNNDDYLLEGSPDGKEWTPLWRVHTVGEAGLRLRMVRTLDATARFVKLSAYGGDSAYSVSELELHTSPDTMKDSGLKRQRGRPSDDVPAALWLATLAAIAYLVQQKQKVLWLVSAPIVAALVWASLTAVLDRFVG